MRPTDRSTRPLVFRKRGVLALMAVCTASNLVWASFVQAGDLDRATCRDLRDTRDALISLGVLSDMQRGPKWAADTLAADRIARIKRYVVTIEQVLFRCGSIPRLVEDGMDFNVNMPDPKPFYERLTFPLPVRKPPVPINLRSTLQ